MTSFNDSINLNVKEDMETDEVKLLDCPEYSNETAEILKDFAFWTEGVVLCGIALPGNLKLNIFYTEKLVSVLFS